MLDDFAPNKRSLLMRIFELLGIVAPPTLVNCWYCNQDSYLLPGSKQTPFYWHCNNCECDNVRDQNGDIVDRLPAMYSEELNRPITAVRDTKQKFQENSVCQDCQKRLAIIYALMKNYIPEEDDPSYATLCKYADEKMQEMHQKYPLCDECEAKLDRFAEEQRDIQRGRRIMEIIDRSQRLGPPPIKPSMQQYRLRGAVWAFFHLMTLYFIFYGIIYPPSHSSFSNLLKEFEKFWRIHILHLCTVWINLYQSQGLLAVGRHIAQVAKDTYWYSVTLSVHTMKRSIACLYMQKMGGHDDEVCGWSLESHIVPLTIFMACSSVCMYWHPLASKTYFEEGVTIMRWKPYKIIQQILCLVRFFILLLPAIVNRDRLSSTLQIIMIVYPTILVSSFFIVRVKNSSWIPSLFPRKRHDEVKPTANMQHQGDNDKGRKSSNISETNSSSLSPLPPDFRPTPEMLKAIKFMPKISSETPTEIDLPQEDPLEKVLNGLQKINLK